MAKHEDQRDPITPRFERKYGNGDLPGPGGMDTENAPSDVAPWDFRLFVNGRWRKNGIAERGGMLPLLDDVLHNAAACVHPTLFDQGTPKKLWMLMDGIMTVTQGPFCAGITGTAVTGLSVATLDPEQDPELQPAIYYQALTGTRGIVGSFGGEPYLMTSDQLLRVAQIRVPFGTPNVVLSGASQTVPIGDPFTGGGIIGTALKEKFGRLFVALNDGAVWSFDGKTFYEETVSPSTPILAFGEWRDFLVAGNATEIFIRDSQGTWTALAAGGGVRQGTASIVSFRDKLCCFDGGAGFSFYDGSGWTAHGVATGSVKCGAVAYGALHYGSDVYGAATMGRTADLITFDDIHKDFTDEVANATDTETMAWYRDTLAVGVMATPLNSYVFQSPSSVTDGTYRTTLTDAGQIRDFLVI